jgi:hypothetical protein
MDKEEYTMETIEKDSLDTTEHNMDAVPKARDLYSGDINAAVIGVQKATGIEINEAWWDANVGNSGSSEEILDRFDKAYAEYVASKSS